MLEVNNNTGTPTAARTLDATTSTVGLPSMTSAAKEGPERKAAGCLRPSADGMSSCMSCPVPTSTPLLREMMGTEEGSRSCNKDVCTGLEVHKFQCYVCGGIRIITSMHEYPLKPHTLMLCKNALLCCTGTACTAYCAPSMAAATSVVATTLGGSTASWASVDSMWHTCACVPASSVGCGAAR